MNTADLITAFFNNEMSPDQERQFLLSVASSDSLRLGLKSHVMLDKILYEESNNSRVSMDVRMNIMKQAALVAAAAGSALSADDALADTVDDTAAPAPRQTAQAGVRSLSRPFFRWSSAALILMLGIGSFFAGFYTGSPDESAANAGVPQKNAITPVTSPEFSTKVPAPASSPSLTVQESVKGNNLPGTAGSVKKETPHVAASSVRSGTRNGQTRTNPAAGQSGRTQAPAGSTEQGNGGTPSSIESDPLKVINDSAK